MAPNVTGRQYMELDGQLHEIKRQLRQKSGYPFSPEQLGQALQNIIEGKFKQDFQTWKTIKLGTGDDFCRVLKSAGHRVSDWAEDLINQPAFRVASKELKLKLVRVTVVELGFKDGATREQIYNRAKELGLELCPAEVGPQLRLQYKDQPMGEWLRIAMEPITVSGGDLRVFSVVRFEDDSWLSCHYGNPGAFWNADDGWVFSLRK